MSDPEDTFGSRATLPGRSASDEAPALPHWIGLTLSGGRYQVLEKIGSGGMGLVYRAHDTRLKTDVVIKVPHADLLGRPGFAERFTREVHALVQLSHPHVCPVLDAGEHGGVPFVVLRYMAGGSLERQWPCDAATRPWVGMLDDMLRWVRPIAEALDFIHSQGYVHRDVKPANILFDSHGNVFLSDFGIAKAAESDCEPQATLTSSWMLLGTPAYMAYEVLMGRAYSARADQYALGVVVYEVLTGRKPYRGPTPAAVGIQQATSAPSQPHKLVSHLPEALSAAVMKALSVDASDRYATCRDLAHAVAEALADTPGNGQVPRPAEVQVGLEELVDLPAEAPVHMQECAAGPDVAPEGLLELPDKRPDAPPAGPSSVAIAGDAALDNGTHTAPATLDASASLAPATSAVAKQPVAAESQARAARRDVSQTRSTDSQALLLLIVGSVGFLLCLLVLAIAAAVTLEPSGDSAEPSSSAVSASTAEQLSPGQVGQDPTRQIQDVVAVFEVRRTPQDDHPVAGVNVQVWYQAGKGQPGVRLGQSASDDQGRAHMQIRVSPEMRSQGEYRASLKYGTLRKIWTLPDFPQSLTWTLRVPAGEDARPAPVGAPLVTNSIGMVLVLMPAGEFMMGSPDSDPDALNDEKPQHRVRITNPFYLGAFEVTVGQFRQFVSATRYGQFEPSDSASDDYPMAGVSWRDARAFCDWLSAKESKTYRLPTEAEWEYACRAGRRMRYGFDESSAELTDYAWFHDNCTKSHLVGQKRPNVWGLHDMQGNLSEWCADWWGENYYGESPSENPNGPDSGLFHVFRGGSWSYSSPIIFRCAHRRADYSHTRNNDVGFRVARDL